MPTTLDEVIERLTTLRAAFAGETVVRINLRESMAEVTGVAAVDNGDEAHIEINAQQ